MTAPLRSGSIRRTLVLQLAGIAALLSLAFFLVVRAVAEQAAEDTQDNILAASATSIADALYSERGFVRIDVEDDGEGVPEELRALLFQPLVTGRRDGTAPMC